MKTFSTLVTSFFLTSSIFAADVKSTASLTVKSVGGNSIVVTVDDKRYDLGSNSIMISDLDACTHQVIVYQQNEQGNTACSGRTYSTLFNSAVVLKPGTNLVINIDNCGIITMNEINLGRRHLGDDWQGGNDRDPGFVNNDIYSKAISGNEFDRVLWAISKESSENNRMESAQQIIHNNYLTTFQVKDLLQLFSLDNNKLELAKLAYEKTVDPSEYFTVRDIFKLDSSKDELARCIRLR